VRGGVTAGQVDQRAVAVRQRPRLERAVQLLAATHTHLDQHAGERRPPDDVDRRLPVGFDGDAPIP
jgi:hypothetical protein